jgi:hypothetical protein
MANIKTRLRMEKAARLTALGLPDAEIALHIGLTPAGYATLKQSPDFRIIATQVATGVISDYDQELFDNLENVKDNIKALVPDALQAFADNVKQKVDPKLRQAAAECIMDRHGIFVKASRAQTPQETDAASFISTKDDEVATNLAAAQTSQSVN